MSKSQYRPYFTESEILALYHLTSTSPEPIHQAIHCKLAQFKLKIATGTKQPAYTNTRESLAEKLGIDDSNTALSPSQKREYLYNLWKQNPAAIIAQSDLEMVQTYRYENGLMSEHEASEFENNLMGV